MFIHEAETFIHVAVQNLNNEVNVHRTQDNSWTIDIQTGLLGHQHCHSICMSVSLFIILV